MNEFEKNNQERQTQDGFYTKKAQDIIQDGDMNSNRQAPPVNQGYTPSYNYSSNFNNYFAQKKANKKRGHSTAVVVISCVLAAIIGSASGIGATLFVKEKQNSNINNGSEITTSNLSITVKEETSSIAEAVALKAAKSVVGIRTTTAVTNFFGGNSESSGEGSGVIYREDGYIITNYHVISDATQNNGSKIEVFLGDANTQSYEASVVGYNISTDLAVLKINATGLAAAELGKVEDLSIGQYVVTIGAPGGLEFMGSVTYGIISGLDRIVSTDSDLGLIQTDAAINPGNSGGALLNEKGELIGINSSKIVAEEFEGMGFAIPIDTVVEKCDKIISRENSPEPYIGVSISERYTSAALMFYGYPAGAVISSVAPGSPAQQAGLERGDIITEFADTKISEYTVFEQVLHDLDPDQTVNIKIYRSGKYYSKKIKIGSDG